MRRYTKDRFIVHVREMIPSLSYEGATALWDARSSGIRVRPEFKSMWVKALESGKYPQTTDTLKGLLTDSTTIGYCCLGVAVEACMPEMWNGNPEDQKFGFWIADGITTVWSTDIRNKFLSGGNDSKRESFVSALAGANDNGAKFDQLAYLIDKYF